MEITKAINNYFIGLLNQTIFRFFPKKIQIAFFDFDVFNRHFKLVKRINKTNFVNCFILDVGGRLHSLNTFIPPDGIKRIFVLNREISDLVGTENERVIAIQGDGIRLPFADNTFDVVTSITTLEHIDKKERPLHFQELIRVCSKKVLIYVPVGPEGDIFEKRLFKWSLNEHIKYMTKQHIDNGLPTLKEIRLGVPGCRITPVQNAYVWLICMILKQVPLFGLFLPSLLYAIFGKLKVKPYYEYLIEYSKEATATGATRKKTILIISKCLPRFDRGSGHVRMFEIIKLLLKHYSVAFVAESFSASTELDDRQYVDALSNLGVKVYAEKYSWKEVEKSDFDLVIISWYHTAIRRLPRIRKQSPSIPIIIDSVDVHFARELQMAEIYKDTNLMKNALRTKKDELAIYREADQIWAVTESDKVILEENDPELDIHIVPNIHEFEPVDRSKTQENSLLFIGNFHHNPNVDAMLYFCGSVLPLILKKKPGVILYIVGHAPPKEILGLVSESVKVTGWVPETRPYLEKCTVSIVPLRFGGGLKGKVGEAMMAGIPVVTTNVGIQGMDVENGTHLLVRNTDEEFAAGVMSLLEDQTLCRKLSENGINYIRQRYAPAVVEKDIVSSCNKYFVNAWNKVAETN